MGNRGARNATYVDPYGYGSLYGYGGAYGTITTPATVVQEPWAVTQWEEIYIPTVRGGRGRRPVIYVAASLPAANPCCGFGGLGGYGGLGGGMGGLGGGLGGLGGGLGGYGGGLGGLGGGLGGYGGGLGGHHRFI